MAAGRTSTFSLAGIDFYTLKHVAGRAALSAGMKFAKRREQIISMATTNRIKSRKQNGKSESMEDGNDGFGMVGQVKRFLHLEGGEKITTLQQLFVEQLRDLYSAENQLIEALPKMAKAAQAAPLKKGFQLHWKETKEHARRLEKILKGLGEKPEGKTCKAMEGLVKEGNETISEDASPAVKDAALIAAAQRVEHYEIAGYGCVRTYATLLNRKGDARILATTLKEEVATDKKLSVAAQTLNVKVKIAGKK
jgi:ferritin-like metal-binding protein YciE